eukprot:TRINITY_DN17352_c0_g1_i4.p1 TRINITY_DN17352_c0_g1~~TRINITY_DN17352_c0_g1_i4.p1  ORF type:complete len:149 (+),score=59.81 TRINITY_DN17352_c0_g1_i4:65-511(+)
MKRAVIVSILVLCLFTPVESLVKGSYPHDVEEFENEEFPTADKMEALAQEGVDEDEVLDMIDEGKDEEGDGDSEEQGDELPDVTPPTTAGKGKEEEDDEQKKGEPATTTAAPTTTAAGTKAAPTTTAATTTAAATQQRPLRLRQEGLI